MVLSLIIQLLIFNICRSYSQTSQGCFNGELRLQGGNLTKEGRLELCLNGVWGAVCNDTWTNVDAGVACSQLNHSAVGASSVRGIFYTESPINIVLAAVRCTGFEQRLVECPNDIWMTNRCTREQTIGVICGDVNASSIVCQNGAIRLQGGSRVSEGRVEVCSNQQWGTVCDDHWDNNDASVACHHLGFDREGSEAFSGGYFSPGRGDILLDDLDCRGTESRLVDCPKHVDYHQCDHSEDAGVRCTGHCQDGDVRLRGGATSLEGRVEICFSRVWGTVCNKIRTEIDVATLCLQLGLVSEVCSNTMQMEVNAAIVCLQLGYASNGARILPSGSFTAGTGIINRKEVNCTGSEIRLIDCPLAPGAETCTHSDDFGVACQKICNNGDLRLVGSNSSNQGRVEVCHNQVWGSVCDDTWATVNAQVVCRQLNYSVQGVVAYRNAFFGSGMGPILYSAIECVGPEARLVDCPRLTPRDNVPQCTHDRDAGVFCPEYCTDGEVRLQGGIVRYQGRVEVCRAQEWGTVCDRSWDKRDATVVCRQLGFPQNIQGVIPFNNSYFGRGSGDILYSQFQCDGSELRLVDCNWGSHENCLHVDDAGVSCSGGPDACFTNDVRLIGGQTNHEGRVEICIDGQWGTVCDNSWDNADAGVVCYELGFAREGSISFHNAYFGLGVGSILVDEVYCEGHEDRLSECRHNQLHPLDSHLCSHSEDAGVRCSDNTKPCKEGSLKLVGGNSIREGRVEICHKNQFGTICDDEWDNLDASVTCVQLGFASRGATAFTTSAFGPGSGNIFFSGVKCMGNEASLKECTHDYRNNTCSHNQDVGVRCANLTLECGPLSDPFCGTVTLTGTRLQSFAVYSCYSRMTPIPSIRTCIQPGIWSAIEPNCTPSHDINTLEVNSVTQYTIQVTWDAVECRVTLGEYVIAYVPEFDLESGTQYMRTSAAFSVITRLVPRTRYRLYVTKDESSSIAQSNVAITTTQQPQKFEFSLKGQVLPNNSTINISTIGIRSSALICVAPCCKNYYAPGNIMLWFYPDGSQVSLSSRLSLTASYRPGLALLHRSSHHRITNGIYTCSRQSGAFSSLDLIYFFGYTNTKPAIFVPWDPSTLHRLTSDNSTIYMSAEFLLDNILLTQTGVICVSSGRLVSVVKWFKDSTEIEKTNSQYKISHHVLSYTRAQISHWLITSRSNLFDGSISCAVSDVEGIVLTKGINLPKSSFKKIKYQCYTVLATAVLAIQSLVI